MPDGQRAAMKAAETQAESNVLRDRVTAAVGDLYLIAQEVGRGGMAVVYAAEDVRLQRPVALKVLPPELAFRGDVRERFVREAQTAARLNHPHIVPIYAVHEEGGLVCFAMALVKGESLAARIVSTFITFVFVVETMVLFRAPDLATAGQVVLRSLGLTAGTESGASFSASAQSARVSNARRRRSSQASGSAISPKAR